MRRHIQAQQQQSLPRRQEHRTVHDCRDGRQRTDPTSAAATSLSGTEPEGQPGRQPLVARSQPGCAATPAGTTACELRLLRARGTGSSHAAAAATWCLATAGSRRRTDAADEREAHAGSQHAAAPSTRLHARPKPSCTVRPVNAGTDAGATAPDATRPAAALAHLASIPHRRFRPRGEPDDPRDGSRGWRCRRTATQLDIAEADVAVSCSEAQQGRAVHLQRRPGQRANGPCEGAGSHCDCEPKGEQRERESATDAQQRRLQPEPVLRTHMPPFTTYSMALRGGTRSSNWVYSCIGVRHLHCVYRLGLSFSLDCWTCSC